MSDIAIRVENLSRQFGDFRAVNGISFEVKKGSVCGFIGANGAGKTTTMRILSTLDETTSGNVEVCGIDVMMYPEKVRDILGWMPDHFGHYQNMNVLEYIDFYARAYGYKGEDREERVRQVMEFTDLLNIQERKSNKLSKGMTQRLSLARTMLHDPEVLILDEPAAGLDPKARVELKNLIRILSDEGKTIFISSHILSELGEMCDSLLFINQGEIVHHGDADSLKLDTNKGDGITYIIELFDDANKLERWVQNNPYIEFIEDIKGGGKVLIDDIDYPERPAEILAKMTKEGIKIKEFSRVKRNLEDAFIDMIHEQNV